VLADGMSLQDENGYGHCGTKVHPLSVDSSKLKGAIMLNKFKSPKFTVRLLVVLAMVLALKFVLGKLTITVIPEVLKFSPAFIANTLYGMIAGPVISFFTFGLFDIVSFILGGGKLFLWEFTAIEAFQGFLYGLLFYHVAIDPKKLKSWLQVSLAVVIIMGVGSFLLTPLVIEKYYHVPFWAQLLGTRVWKFAEIPIRIVAIMAIFPALQRIPQINKYLKS
jgi:ECF transporter S component (folate family)